MRFHSVTVGHDSMESASAQSDLTKDRIVANRLHNVLQAQLT